MINLSTYARRRDVIQSDSAKLSLLVQRTLNKNLPKDPNNTFSTWNQAVLDADQEKYAALDVIAHLLVYEKLESMTDLKQRLKKIDLFENQVVDLAPASGAGRGMMATRAATARVLDAKACTSPDGIKPSCYSAGRHSVVVEIIKIHSPSFKVPYYTVHDTSEDATLDDIGQCPIVVSCRMLRPHMSSDTVRATPSSTGIEPLTSQPAVEITSQRATAIHELASVLHLDDDENIDENEMGEVVDSCEPTSDNIETLRAVLVTFDKPASKLKDILKSTHLDPPPAIIEDRYSAVLGDPFHAIQRPYVSNQHDALKMYSVAFSEAMFCWNKKKLAELEGYMRTAGMDQSDIEKVRILPMSLYLKICSVGLSLYRPVISTQVNLLLV